MSYKLGILNTDFIDYHESDDLSYENKQLIKYANDILGQCCLIDPTMVQINFFKDKQEILYCSNLNKGNSHIISELDSILVRRTRRFSEQTYDIISAIHSAYPHITIFDPPESFDRPLSKVPTLIERAPHFMQPDTVILLNLNTTPELDGISYPVFAKPTHGFKGRETKKCKNKDELASFIKNIRNLTYEDMKEKQTLGYGILIQEYIKFDEEYRVNVVGGKSIGCVAKISEKDTKNADQGAVFIERNNQSIVEIAEKCAKVQNLSFAGVDIASKDGTYYVIECNRNPAFENFDKALNKNSARNLIDYIRSELCHKLKKEKVYQKNNTKHLEKTQNDAPSDSKIVFKEPVIGSQIFVNSSQTRSESSFKVNDFDHILNQLFELINNSNMPQITKNDANNDLNGIKELKKEPSSPDVMSSIERKTSSLNKIIKNCTDIAAKGAPLLNKLVEFI